MANMESMRKTTKQATLVSTGALLISSFLSFPAVFGQEQPSLIESALDAKFDAQPRETSAPSKPVKTESIQGSTKTSTHKAHQSSVPKSTTVSAGKPVVKLLKPDANQAKLSRSAGQAKETPQAEGNVTLVPVQTKGSADDIPEPTGMLEPPIHSAIPYHQPKLPGFDIKVGAEKLDKSFAVDPTYRGKPILPVVPAVTFGAPSWAIPNKKKIAVGTGTIPSAPVTLSAPAPAARAPLAADAQSNLAKAQSQPELYELNVRIMTDEKFQRKDTLWAYPYPPKPPKQVIPNPLPETEGQLKSMLLTSGYSNRPDETRPYPSGGWRWVKALDNAIRKAKTGYPHTMFTMYPWVDKMFPYVRSECHELNLVEEKRSQHYEQILKDYERIHTDIESLATSRGLVPVEIKVNPRGIAQTKLPQGNWWITASRSYPGLKFYWYVPISLATEKIVNIQMNEADALIVAGAW